MVPCIDVSTYRDYERVSLAEKFTEMERYFYKNNSLNLLSYSEVENIVGRFTQKLNFYKLTIMTK